MSLVNGNGHVLEWSNVILPGGIKYHAESSIKL